jgi:hypothetical protein
LVRKCDKNRKFRRCGKGEFEKMIELMILFSKNKKGVPAKAGTPFLF